MLHCIQVTTQVKLYNMIVKLAIYYGYMHVLVLSFHTCFCFLNCNKSSNIWLKTQHDIKHALQMIHVRRDTNLLHCNEAQRSEELSRLNRRYKACIYTDLICMSLPRNVFNVIQNKQCVGAISPIRLCVTLSVSVYTKFLCVVNSVQPVIFQSNGRQKSRM